MIAELALAAHIFLGSSLLGGHIDVVDFNEGRRICYEYVDGSFVPFHFADIEKLGLGTWCNWHCETTENWYGLSLVHYDEDGFDFYNTDNHWFPIVIRDSVIGRAFQYGL